MTSRMIYIFPACLMVFVLTLAFVNVAYADEPIWRETNNLYNGQIEEIHYQYDANYPYRLYLLNRSDFLDPGTYSISFENSSSIQSDDVLIVNIDGQSSYAFFQGTQTFEVPEEYDYVSVFIGSKQYIPSSDISKVMLNSGSPLPYEPYYSGFRFDFAAIANNIGQYVQPVITMILPYIFLMIALIIGINAGIRVFRKTAI